MSATAAALAHADDLADFVAASPSSFHAAAEVARRLTAAGFTYLDETAPWSVEPGARQLVVRDGAVIAWIVPGTATAETPFHIFGADLPCLFCLSPGAEAIGFVTPPVTFRLKLLELHRPSFVIGLYAIRKAVLVKPDVLGWCALGEE